jgi:hypothetical protein
MSSKLSKLLTVAVVATAALSVELIRRRLGEQRGSSAHRLERSRDEPAPAPVGAPTLDAATRDQLYREAQRLAIPGRSKMTKAELKTALRKGA